MFDVDVINDLLFQCDAIQGYGATLGKPRPLPSVLDSVVFQQTLAYSEKVKILSKQRASVAFSNVRAYSHREEGDSGEDRRGDRRSDHSPL